MNSLPKLVFFFKQLISWHTKTALSFRIPFQEQNVTTRHYFRIIRFSHFCVSMQALTYCRSAKSANTKGNLMTTRQIGLVHDWYKTGTRRCLSSLRLLGWFSTLFIKPRIIRLVLAASCNYVNRWKSYFVLRKEIVVFTDEM